MSNLSSLGVVCQIVASLKSLRRTADRYVTIITPLVHASSPDLPVLEQFWDILLPPLCVSCGISVASSTS